jgi:hypothetical protein
MRKYFILAALVIGAAIVAMPVVGTQAREWVYVPKKPPPPPKGTWHQHHHVGPWAIGCGLASAGTLMVGTAIKGSDKNDQRQLTITEAGWASAACPFMLPWALLMQATCPDNKATYTVARLAFRAVKNHPGTDQSAFTNAYGEACRTGKLSRETKRHLISLAS